MERRLPIRLRARHTFWRRHPAAAPDAPTTPRAPEGWAVFPSFAIVGAGPLTAARLARTRALLRGFPTEALAATAQARAERYF
jgi:hypothetical protein